MTTSPARVACALLALAGAAHGAPAAPAVCAAAALAPGQARPIAASGLIDLLQQRARDTILSEWTGRYLVVMGRYAPLGAAVYDACRDAWDRVPEWTGAKALGTELLLTRWSGRRVIVTSGDGRPIVELDPETLTWTSPGEASRAGAAMTRDTWVWRAQAPGSSVTWFARATETDRVSGKQIERRFAAPPAARSSHVEVLRPGQVLIWGGTDDRGLRADGAILDVTRRRWRPLPAAGAPRARAEASFAWASGRLAVWGGWGIARGKTGPDALECLTDGAIYDPARSRWSPIAPAHAPTPRENAIQVVDGERLYVLGGTRGCSQRADGERLADGAVLDVTTGRWRPLSLPAPVTAAPTYPLRPSGHALPDRRIVVQGTPASWIYDPRADAFTALPAGTEGRFIASGVEGGLMIRWGRVEQVTPGGGCEGPGPPGMGCDPVPGITAYHDEGWLVRF